jgi:hypothetical protein
MKSKSFYRFNNLLFVTIVRHSDTVTDEDIINDNDMISGDNVEAVFDIERLQYAYANDIGGTNAVFDGLMYTMVIPFKEFTNILKQYSVNPESFLNN